MKTGTQIRWGFLGCSRIALNKVIPEIQSLSHVKLMAIASRSIAKARACVLKWKSIAYAYGHYEELLENPNIDAVYISLPNSMHHEWTLKALAYGKHVLCEKPAGLYPDELRHTIELCSAGDLTFMEGFMYRFHPQHRHVKALITEGRIGELKLIRASFSYPFDAGSHSDIRLRPSLGGGSLLDVGCYCIHLCRSIFGTEPEEVLGHAAFSNPNQVDMSFAGILDFPGHKTAIIDCSLEMQRRNTYEVIGKHGKIVAVNGFIPSGETHLELDDDQGNHTRITFAPVRQFAAEFDFFSAALLENNRLAQMQSDALNNAVVLEALGKSSRIGERVSLTTGSE